MIFVRIDEKLYKVISVDTEWDEPVFILMNTSAHVCADSPDPNTWRFYTGPTARILASAVGLDYDFGCEHTQCSDDQLIRFIPVNLVEDKE